MSPRFGLAADAVWGLRTAQRRQSPNVFLRFILSGLGSASFVFGLSSRRLGSGRPGSGHRKTRPQLEFGRAFVTRCAPDALVREAPWTRQSPTRLWPGTTGPRNPGVAARARLVRERRRQRQRGRAPRRDADDPPLGQEGIPGRLAREGDDLHRPDDARRRRHARARAPALRQGAPPAERRASRRARPCRSRASRSPRSASIRPWSRPRSGRSRARGFRSPRSRPAFPPGSRP